MRIKESLFLLIRLWQKNNNTHRHRLERR